MNEYKTIIITYLDLFKEIRASLEYNKLKDCNIIYCDDLGKSNLSVSKEFIKTFLSNDTIIRYQKGIKIDNIIYDMFTREDNSILLMATNEDLLYEYRVLFYKFIVDYINNLNKIISNKIYYNIRINISDDYIDIFNSNSSLDIFLIDNKYLIDNVFSLLSKYYKINIIKKDDKYRLYLNDFIAIDNCSLSLIFKISKYINNINDLKELYLSKKID